MLHGILEDEIMKGRIKSIGVDSDGKKKRIRVIVKRIDLSNMDCDSIISELSEAEIDKKKNRNKK